MHTLEAVIGFFILYSVAIFAFANFFYVLNYNVPKGGFKDGNSFIQKYTGNNMVDSIIDMYMLSLGEFNYEGYG
jgi:hypothetical protein